MVRHHGTVSKGVTFGLDQFAARHHVPLPGDPYSSSIGEQRGPLTPGGADVPGTSADRCWIWWKPVADVATALGISGQDD